jgi:hypothetical protein
MPVRKQTTPPTSAQGVATAPTLAGAADQTLLSEDLAADTEFQRFRDAAQAGNLVPLYERVMSDQLTPVLAYRCLVHEDDREAPSFLFESVVNGDQQVNIGCPGTAAPTETLVVLQATFSAVERVLQQGHLHRL